MEPKMSPGPELDGVEVVLGVSAASTGAGIGMAIAEAERARAKREKIDEAFMAVQRGQLRLWEEYEVEDEG